MVVELWLKRIRSESDTANSQFKLDIRNEPIHEEDSDAQTALSNVANTLRAVSKLINKQFSV